MKIKLFQVLIIFLVVVLTACSSQTPAPTVAATTSASLSTATPEPTQSTWITVSDIQIGTITGSKVYGCSGGLTVNPDTVSYSTCESDVATVTLRDGTVITASLYGEPQNPKYDETVTVTMSVSKVSAGVSEEALCSVTDGDNKPVGKTFVAKSGEKSLRGFCQFLDGMTVFIVNAVYTQDAACTPKVIWTSQSEANYVLTGAGTYVAELAFPSVTDPIFEPVTHPNWSRFTLGNQILTFTGAVGTIWKFDSGCDEIGQNVFTSSLSSFPITLQSWADSGRLK